MDKKLDRASDLIDQGLLDKARWLLYRLYYHVDKKQYIRRRYLMDKITLIKGFGIDKWEKEYHKRNLEVIKLCGEVRYRNPLDSDSFIGVGYNDRRGTFYGIYQRRQIMKHDKYDPVYYEPEEYTNTIDQDVLQDFAEEVYYELPVHWHALKVHSVYHAQRSKNFIW